ncbi:MAG: hypothetical protein ABSH22_17830 [Tepidisphaeraceae bacterium]|jgi:hypothetical protein
MSTETATETNHAHAHSHSAANHSAHKPKTRARSAANHRRSSSRASHPVGGRLASALSLSGLPGNVADGVTEQLTDLREKGMQTAEAFEKSILKHPKSSVLIAFGIGYAWARLRRWF